MKVKPFLLAVLYFIAVIVLAHFFIPPNYDWTQNTISDLASQGHAYKWIMQAGFVGFGLLLAAGSIYYFWQNKKRYFLWLVTGYGLSVLVTGFYCAAAIDPSIEYSLQEARIHSTFATIAGVCMSMGIIWQIVASSTRRERWARIIFLLFVVGISGLFGLAENHILEIGKGIAQRALYFAGLAWLVYEERQIYMEAQ
ncbi:MAG: DUF998 domain-containing protein [Anaerolineae bacterium]|nr:DUF998 domain-containing protein [Anaerolineae bacterium]